MNKILKFPVGFVGTSAVKQVMLDQMTLAEIKEFFDELLKAAKLKAKAEAPSSADEHGSETATA